MVEPDELPEFESGNVVTTLDTRGAAIAGLVGGLFGGLMLLLGRFLLRRA